jgi:predicted ATPase
MESSEMTVDSIRAFPAVELFLKLATETLVDLTIDDSQARMIAELCRQLDGVPLAIELAAVRVRLLGFEGLSSVASDHFLRFCQGHRTGPPRHESLAAAYEWSFDLLPEHERSALLRLSALSGSFDLETAVSVASNGATSAVETTSSIANLVSKSLIERLDQGASNFRILSLVRYFASKTLMPRGDLRERETEPRCSVTPPRTGSGIIGAKRPGVVNTRNHVVAINLLHARSRSVHA